jgi:hypothetical protein
MVLFCKAIQPSFFPEEKDSLREKDRNQQTKPDEQNDFIAEKQCLIRITVNLTISAQVKKTTGG